MWLQLRSRFFNRLKLFCLALFGFKSSELLAQDTDSLPKPVIHEIEWQSGVYLQDGEHSAVTGGEGTEKLQVYRNKFAFSKSKTDRYTYQLSAGVDFITSASTDKIDFDDSSASRHDAHTYVQVAYGRTLPKSKAEVQLSTGLAFESDYLSVPAKVSVNYPDPSRSRNYNLELEAFFDDLRWGRLSKGFFNPVELVYPSELRNREWHDTHERKTYNFKFGLEQVINKRSNAALLLQMSYQKGLLSTPFHRVIFNDGEKRVEQLPSERFRFPLALRWNYFLNSNSIIKMEIDYYVDNFDIDAISGRVEFVKYLKNGLSLKPHFSLYTQSASKYFKPINEHNPSSIYYTSDYDLSHFTSFKTGIALRIISAKFVSEQKKTKDLEIRYAFTNRDDGLQAHIMTLTYRLLKE